MKTALGATNLIQMTAIVSKRIVVMEQCFIEEVHRALVLFLLEMLQYFAFITFHQFILIIIKTVQGSTDDMIPLVQLRKNLLLTLLN